MLFDVVFVLSWSLLGSILDLQDDLRDLNKRDYSLGIRRVSKDRFFIYEDYLESVVELFWAPFWRSWGSLGSPFGPPDRTKRGDTH